MENQQRDFQIDLTQTGLYCHRSWLEARNFRLREELYYPYRENKDADQPRGYREAVLRLWFGICRLLVFS